MKKTAAELAIYALEQLGITHTFGIPGVHNTELYDALSQSKQINPILVTNEQSGAFIAEGMSRASHSANIGTLMIVPAAGLTHAASGIGEAYLGGIPMLVITGGIRRDTPYRYKLHEVDQLEVAKGFTKAAFRVETHEEVISTIFKAYELATEGLPGPVLVEIPVDLQLFKGTIPGLPQWSKRIHWSDTPARKADINQDQLETCAKQLIEAKQVAMFVGWGARWAKQDLVELAELLGAPVATSLQGLSSFPHAHPLHAGFSFSASAVPSAKKAYKRADCLLAIGVRFAEIPTGSFNLDIPEKLVHLDIDPEAIDANYPSTASLIGDSAVTVPALLDVLRKLRAKQAKDLNQEAFDRALFEKTRSVRSQIEADKAAYQKEWLDYKANTTHALSYVNPAKFFNQLRAAMPDNAITVLDDGNHTFMTAELFEVGGNGVILTPTDYNAMGYAVPAAIGAKLSNPERMVFSIVGDGCFAMTCMELATATEQRLGIIYFIFNDGELSQIAQAQQIPYRKKACTQLPNVKFEGVAQATGAAYLPLVDNDHLEEVIEEAKAIAKKGQPVIVDIKIDYSKKTAFTKGTSASTFKNFELGDKLRFAKRAIGRRLI